MNATTIQINPNLRVDGDKTMADLDQDVHGAEPQVFDQVIVLEPASGLVGRGWVTEIDTDERTVTLAVDWSSLRLARNAVHVGAHPSTPNRQVGPPPLLVPCVA